MGKEVGTVRERKSSRKEEGRDSGRGRVRENLSCGGQFNGEDQKKAVSFEGMEEAGPVLEAWKDRGFKARP